MKKIDYTKKDLIKINKNKISKIFFRPFYNLYNLIKFLHSDKLYKLIKAFDSIEDININDENDVMIKFKNSLVINSNGSQIYYSKNNPIITSAYWTSENPIYNPEPFIDKLDIKSLIKKDYDTTMFLLYSYKDLKDFKFSTHKPYGFNYLKKEFKK